MSRQESDSISSHQSLLANSILLADCLQSGAALNLLEKARTRFYRKGSVFFRKGDPGDVMFAIAKGMVRISSSSEDGKEIVLGLLGPGDLFGEISLLDGKARAADVAAMTDCSVLVLSRQDFISHISASPDFALGVMRSLARRLRATDSQVEDAAFLSLPGRLAKRMLALARDYGIKTEDGVLIQLRLSQQDLANLVGVSRESVNRLMASWAAEGLLAREGRNIVLRDLARIEDLSAE